MEKGTLLFAQSGGPTAVINASAAGVITEAQKSKQISRIIAARYGMDGILAKNFIDVTAMNKDDVKLLKSTPASAFGSCRYKLPDAASNDLTYKALKEIFTEYNVKYFVYNGGNDSMDTCRKIADYFKAISFDCRVIGVPKTVDNDLVGTDHCPGYGSAAKFIATTMSELALDTQVYAKGRVTVCEIMGRDAGWLTAASAVASYSFEGPDLIYVPENVFETDKFFNDALEIYGKKNRCLVALSEGIRDGKGSYIGSGGGKDSFNHVQLGGAAAYLADVLATKFNVKTRAVELSLPQRASGHLASLTDMNEAYGVGVQAVKYAVSGKSGLMVNILRTSDEPYEVAYSGIELSSAANAVKKLPANYITQDGKFIAKDFMNYVSPLIRGESEVSYRDGLPRYFKL